MPDMKYAMFPFDPMKAKVAGGLAQSPMHTPSATGFDNLPQCKSRLTASMRRVEKAGGKITMLKTSIGQNGFMAFFTDSEGNTMAIHSNN